jgi:hypothetical protein
VIAIGSMLADLLDRIPLHVVGTEVSVEVTEVELALPIESRITDDATLLVSAPRGRLATGFDPHAGHVRVTFVGRSP